MLISKFSRRYTNKIAPNLLHFLNFIKHVALEFFHFNFPGNTLTLPKNNLTLLLFQQTVKGLEC